MHSAFNLLVFLNSMFTPLLLLFFFIFIERDMCSPEKYHLEITIIIIIIIIPKNTMQRKWNQLWTSIKILLKKQTCRSPQNKSTRKKDSGGVI